jgi:hypothetical protein
MDSDRQGTRFKDTAAFGLVLGLGSLMVLVMGHFDDDPMAWWEGPGLAALSFLGFKLAIGSVVHMLTRDRQR